MINIPIVMATLQRRKNDWDYDAIRVYNRVERMRTCSICSEKFTSFKKARQHKRNDHAY